MKTWEAKSKHCPVMSRPVTYNNGGHLYSSMHWQVCLGDHCPMWVGDHNEGRCGMVRISDAEAMKSFMGGN